MFRDLWCPKALKIDLVKFRQAVPHGIYYLLHRIIDRLKPTKDDMGGGFRPLDFGGSFDNYINFLIDEGVIKPDLCRNTHVVAERYKEGDYYTFSFSKDLVDSVDTMIIEAELRSGKIIIGSCHPCWDQEDMSW